MKLIATIQKELLLLFRDKGGIAILFLMPMALITIMALIQDAPFKDYQEIKIPLLLVNNDTGTLGTSIEKGVIESKIFDINKYELSNDAVKQKIKSGDFEIGIIIPKNATQILYSRVNKFVNKKLTDVGLSDNLPTQDSTTSEALNINILFAPETKPSFKISILNSLKQSTSKIETQTLLSVFEKELNKDSQQVKTEESIDSFVQLNEIKTVETEQEALKLNSVQHNVPAWTIFGIFFIVITLAGNIIKEREDGSILRIRTMPSSYFTVLSGKIIAYLFITIIQAVLMLLVGIYLLPTLGLPHLIIGSNFPAIAMVVISTGLAATGYGVMVGNIFKTHQQASTFGAVSVVILAALGGIWVPVYVMPEAVRILSEFSPLYWSLSAFHKLFMNNAGITTIFPAVLKLIAFFLICLIVANIAEREKR